MTTTTSPGNKEFKQPRVGVGVFVIKDGKVLLGCRENSHQSGSRSILGGHLEYGESLEECVVREVREEAGIEISNIQFVTLTNDLLAEEGKHYVSIFMVAEYLSGKIHIQESEKCSELRRCDWDDLPHPLSIRMQKFLTLGINPLQLSFTRYGDIPHGILRSTKHANQGDATKKS